jgi:hypothetical protein
MLKPSPGTARSPNLLARAIYSFPGDCGNPNLPAMGVHIAMNWRGVTICVYFHLSGKWLVLPVTR